MKTEWKANSTTHSLAEETGLLSHLFSDVHQNFPELLRLGAVYVNKKRTLSDIVVQNGDYVRIHGLPKRFPVQEIHWEKRVIAETEYFVIVDKPSGIPVHPMVDNLSENVASLLSAQLGYPLFVTHRLDTVTCGLLLLAKTPRFQAIFNRMLSKRRVEKTYSALFTSRPIEGLWQHWMKKSPLVPKELSRTPLPDYLICETLISNVQPFENVWEALLHPKTGRTHQLRAQLAVEGCPLLGDVLYGGSEQKGFYAKRIALHASKLSFILPNSSIFSCETAPPWKC